MREIFDTAQTLARWADFEKPGRLVIRLQAAAAHAAAGRRLARALRRQLAALGVKSAELSVALVGDARMRALNRKARGIDRSTDVLSFPAAAAPGSVLLGDLVISVPLARRVARALGRDEAEELRLYAAHGLLHLLGHDHARASDRHRMARAELALLGETGLLLRPEPPPRQRPPRVLTHRPPRGER